MFKLLHDNKKIIYKKTNTNNYNPKMNLEIFSQKTIIQGLRQEFMGFVLEKRDETGLVCYDPRKSASHTNKDVRDLSGGDCDASI